MGTDLTSCSRGAPAGKPCEHRDGFVKRGFYKRKWDGRVVQRYRCRTCGKSVSDETGSVTYRQHKPYLNFVIAVMKCCSVAQNRIALINRINRKTVARKLIYMGRISRLAHDAWLECLGTKLQDVHFDDMETHEHSKMKPLSIPLVVEARTRRIIAFDVARMPCKGRLAAKSRKKYGKRADDRPLAWRRVLEKLARHAVPEVRITSDSNPHYPAVIRQSLPRAIHRTVLSRRACTVGQGELKLGGRDPLFWLNHTAAMLRDNIKRLTRRTWCTTKDPRRLADHTALYVVFHNTYLLRKKSRVSYGPAIAGLFPRAAA